MEKHAEVRKKRKAESIVRRGEKTALQGNRTQTGKVNAVEMGQAGKRIKWPVIHKIAGVCLVGLVLTGTVTAGVSGPDTFFENIAKTAKGILRVQAEEGVQTLTFEEVNALYQQGYGLLDIKKAEEIWQKTGVLPEQLLLQKGKTVDLINETVEEQEAAELTLIENSLAEKAGVMAGTDGQVIGGQKKLTKTDVGKADLNAVDMNARSSNGKSWKQIEIELGIYVENPMSETGMTTDVQNELMERGYSESEINIITDILARYEMTVDDLEEVLPEEKDIPQILNGLKEKEMRALKEEGKISEEELQTVLNGNTVYGLQAYVNEKNAEKEVQS